MRPTSALHSRELWGLLPLGIFARYPKRVPGRPGKKNGECAPARVPQRENGIIFGQCTMPRRFGRVFRRDLAIAALRAPSVRALPVQDAIFAREERVGSALLEFLAKSALGTAPFASRICQERKTWSLLYEGDMQTTTRTGATKQLRQRALLKGFGCPTCNLCLTRWPAPWRRAGTATSSCPGSPPCVPSPRCWISGL